MKYSYVTLLLAAVSSLALGSGNLRAQDAARVVINEVNLRPANPGESRWIELHNLGELAADLTGWGLHHSSKAQGLPGSHWWAFPNGTTLASGSFLRVHWYAAYQPHTDTDFYTGTHPLRFLFSLGGEALSASQGAIALLNDNSAAATNRESSYEDWISWGQSGYPQEGLAISNGRWLDDDFVPPLLSVGSIALDHGSLGPVGQSKGAAAFFHDSSPTPLDFNHRDVQISDPIGWSCAIGSMNPPRLELRSVPTAGNTDFAISVLSNNGGFDTQIVLLLATPTAGMGLSLPGVFECPLWVDLNLTPWIFMRTSEGGDTEFLLPLDSLPGGFEVTFQALLIKSPFSAFDHASSKGLTMRLGY